MMPAHILRKAFLFFLAIILTAFVFTACGGKDDADEDDEDTKKTEAKGGGFSGGDKTISLPGNVKLKLVKVEAGTIGMTFEGGERSYSERTKSHPVTFKKDFYIGQTEVTQAQWKAVMGNNPSDNSGDDLPVENVSWNEAMEFCEKLNETGMAPDGWMFTMPTEKQWEYAARGGKKSKGYKYSGSNSIGEVAWFNKNSGLDPHPVARKRANELGLYDMSGNVWEWCLDDWYTESDRLEPEFTRDNDYAYGWDRVCRGGSWNDDEWPCRSVYRVNFSPRYRCGEIGFRVALVSADGRAARTR